MHKDFINWGVISCAKIANKAVIPGIRSAGNARLYAISSRSKEKLEEFKGRHSPVKAYLNYEDILDDPQVDAVYIPLPNSMHYEWVLKAAEKKKHILCEKPLGCTAEEVRKMKTVCERNGVLLMEAFAYRHSPLTLKVKELADSGIIGRLKVMESFFSFPVKDLTNVRLVKSLSGGSNYDIGCYNINIIRYIAGTQPVSVFATGEIGPETGVDESSYSILEFEGGLKGISHSAFNCTERCGYRIIGESGVIKVPVKYNAKGELNIVIDKDNNTEVIKVECPDNYMLEVEQFGRCILEGETPLVSLDDSYKNALVIDEILKQVYRHK